MDGLENKRECSSPDPSLPHYELFYAAYKDKLSSFKRLALNQAEAEGIGVPEAIGMLVNDVGRGSLSFAAGGGSLNVCKYLLEELKLDVDFKDKMGRTALHHAILRGHLDTVTYLLDKGASADAEGASADASSNNINVTPSPLHFAAMRGDTKIISLLLSRGVRVDAAVRFGTALQYAVNGDHRDAIKVLLDHGANPNVIDNEGMRPLMAAIHLESWESMELLLQAGADPNAESCGDTPLIYAATENHVDVVTRLLEAGADPNYKKMSLGLTALELAAIKCKYQSVGVLFPVTSRIPTYPDWSITGLMRHVNSFAKIFQIDVYRKEKFHEAKSKGRDAFQEEQYLKAVHWFKEAWRIYPQDPAVLSNMSACFARLGDGINALAYATKCQCEKPEWPKAYYRLGVALNLQKRYDDAADAFNRGLALDPRNKELKDAYMKAVEARVNSM